MGIVNDKGVCFLLIYVNHIGYAIRNGEECNNLTKLLTFLD